MVWWAWPTSLVSIPPTATPALHRLDNKADPLLTARDFSTRYKEEPFSPFSTAMKQSILLFCALLFTSLSFAQPPQKMSYQTVIRNATDDLVSNSTVGIQISVLQGTSSGTAVYVETHAPTTNANGLASLEIGGGTPVTGTMAAIDWGAGPYFVKSEVDPDGGTNYSLSVTSELLAVPYALHALDVENKDDADADPTNEIELPANGQEGQFLRIIAGQPTWVFPDTEPPSIPTGLASSNVTPTSLDLTWDPSTDNIGVGGYRILQDGVLIPGITDTIYQANGLVPLTSYDFSIQAYDLDGNSSAFSNSLIVDREPPSAPQNLFPSNINPISGSTLDLNWSASTDDVQVSEYEIFQDGVSIATIPASSLTFQVTGLSGNTSYEFYVRATDTAGNVGAPSDSFYVDRQPPSVPGNFMVSETPFDMLAFSWTASQDDLGIDEYQIEELGDLLDSQSYSLPGGASSVEIPITGFIASSEFRIRAVDVSGYVGPWTDYFYLDLSAPSTPNTILVSVEPGGCSGLSAIFTFTHTVSTDDVDVVLYQMYIDEILVAASSPNVIEYVTPCQSVLQQPDPCVTAQDAAGNTSSCN
jgi:chitodextrinase